MIDYGRIALNKVKSIEDDNSRISYNFKKYEKKYSVTATSYTITLVVSSLESVIFTIDCAESISYKVYLNEKLVMIKNSLQNSNFSLTCGVGGVVTFEFTNDQEYSVNLSILGNFDIKKEDSFMMTTCDSFTSIVHNYGTYFEIYDDTSADNALSKYNANNRTTKISGEFLYISHRNSYIALYNLGSYTRVYGEYKKVLGFKADCGVMFYPNINNVGFGVAYLTNKKIAIKLFTATAGLYKTIAGIEILKIPTIVDIVDAFVYSGFVLFVVTDVNNNSHLLLCKISENDFILSLITIFHISDMPVVAAKSFFSGESILMFGCQGRNKIKLLYFKLDTAAKTLSLQKSLTYQNADSVGILDKNNIIIGYDQSLEKINIE